MSFEILRKETLISKLRKELLIYNSSSSLLIIKYMSPKSHATEFVLLTLFHCQ